MTTTIIVGIVCFIFGLIFIPLCRAAWWVLEAIFEVIAELFD